MKKLLTIFIAVFLFSMMTAPTAFADDTIYTEGTLHYTVANESVTIVNCFGKDAEVWVPAMIAGDPVNTIASGAFAENRYVQTLYLPDTITTIEPGAIGDWIYVVYNANTDHPQDTPTDLILGNVNLIPDIPEADTPPVETVEELVEEVPQGSGTADLDSNEEEQEGTTPITEYEGSLEEAEDETPAPATPSPEPAETPESEESAEPASETTGEDGEMPEDTPDEAAPAEAEESGGEGDGKVAGLALAFGGLAVIAGGTALLSKRRKTDQNQ